MALLWWHSHVRFPTQFHMTWLHSLYAIQIGCGLVVMRPYKYGRSVDMNTVSALADGIVMFISTIGTLAASASFALGNLVRFTFVNILT
ncbi:hypothetical protein DERP_009737 [Dermatophagoides pteronyssinus]|uniref:Uncharacterized protein n=1 Tax=Dermatophagoides pteronyssinus TaxID=6956 RepID=A0ABQ8IR08_DERPT|nr:hypothetical protein DERP_009737 [Dermatophagoides pteronyssinus]